MFFFIDLLMQHEFLLCEFNEENLEEEKRTK